MARDDIFFPCGESIHRITHIYWSPTVSNPEGWTVFCRTACEGGFAISLSKYFVDEFNLSVSSTDEEIIDAMLNCLGGSSDPTLVSGTLCNDCFMKMIEGMNICLTG